MKYIQKLLIVIAVSFLCSSVYAQVTAKFSASKTTGCGNTEIEFTDQSTGNPTLWEWDFGNGLKKTEKISKSYKFAYPAGTYTVVLKVSDGTSSHQTSITIVINPVPQPDFEVESFSGCVTTEAVFTDLTQSESPIVKYGWVFGDAGNSSVQNPTHTYIGEGSYTVGLTVVDENGCKDTKVKENLVDVTKPLSLSFVANGATESCAAPLTTAFTPTVSNGTVEEYLWNFGDGNTDVVESPTHLYEADGAYTVSLTVKTSSGCPTTVTRNGYIQINTFAASIISKNTACLSTPFSLQGNTNSSMGTWDWDLGDGTSVSEQNPTVTYAADGDYVVTLNAESAIGCKAIATKTIKVNPQMLANFSADALHGCSGSDFTTIFTSDALGMASYVWDFGDGTTQTTTANTVSHTYTDDGSYTISLVETNADGCQASFDRANYIHVENPEARYDLSSTDNLNFCLGSTTSITNTSTTNYGSTLISSWDCDYDISAHESEIVVGNVISIKYASEGVYPINLSVEDEDGCISVYSDTVRIGAKPTMPTITAPLDICFREFADITASDNGDASIWRWSFGDGSPDTSYNVNAVSYKFLQPGDFTIKLITKNFSCPSDTATSDITINVPQSIFSFDPQALCTFPDIINFDGSASIGAVTYEWDFDDGSPLSNDAAPTHEYASAGTYNVKLVTTAGACSDILTTAISTSGLTIGFTQDTTEICKNDVINFQDTSIVKAGAKWQYIWDFGDGSSIDTLYTDAVTHQYTKDGNFSVKLVIVTAGGCKDSLEKVNKYTVNPLPGITTISADVTDGCAPLSTNLSVTASSIIPIQSYSWNFGDGTTASSEQNPTHSFVNPGSYDVTITVTDDKNCSFDSTKIDYINPTFPSPNFTIPARICSYNELSTINTSSGATLTYAWEWGDLATSTETSPKHMYQGIVSDTSFEITLTATDKNDCVNHITKTIAINHPIADFESPSTAFQCPPADVSFENKSIGTGLSYQWNFGLPTTTPIIVEDAFWQYYSAGEYDITLVSTDNFGCSNTLIRPSYVVVNGPQGALQISPNQGCTYTDIAFNAINTKNVADYSWIYGDGEFDKGSADFSEYVYPQGGVYTPSLTITDLNGCEVTLFAGTVTINGVVSDFSSETLVCESTNIQLNDMSVATPSPVESWTWIITKGEVGIDTIKTQNLDYLFDYGVYNIKLITEVQGCVYSKDSLNFVKVYETPAVDFAIDKNPIDRLEMVHLTNNTDTLSLSEHVYWNWDMGDFSTLHNFEFLYMYSEGGEYDIRLIGYTHEECMDTLILPITVNANVSIPNVFTPNGDGINDVFLSNTPSVTLIVMNRWGQELYQGTEGWDGTFNGNEMSAGTYFYIITMPNGEKHEGPLMLIRK